LTFDFHDHALIGETADMRESFPLEARLLRAASKPQG
jgi:hypothetical protein